MQNGNYIWRYEDCAEFGRAEPVGAECSGSAELIRSEHTIKISKPGYKDWECKMETTSGDMKIAPNLEEQSQSEPNAVGAPNSSDRSTQSKSASRDIKTGNAKWKLHLAI